AVYRTFIDALNRQNLEAAARLVDPARYRENCVGFTRGFVGWEAAKESVRQVWQGLPDLRVELHDVLSAGDVAVARGTVRGTALGRLYGAPATKRACEASFFDYIKIDNGFDIPINKDVVRRILASRHRPEPDSAGPSWLTVLGHAKDSLWSLDLFRCESAVLRTHSVLVVMDQFPCRIVGFGVHRGVVDGVALCRMFNRATRGQNPPTYVSSDHDPLYRFSQWQRNLRILDVQEIKTVPYAPLSHPCVERLIGTIRRECLDRTLFRTTAHLQTKLLDFQPYYTAYRAHGWLAGRTPHPSAEPGRARAPLTSHRWQMHCRGLHQTPIAA